MCALEYKNEHVITNKHLLIVLPLDDHFMRYSLSASYV
jgi:hypothetical protein